LGGERNGSKQETWEFHCQKCREEGMKMGDDQQEDGEFTNKNEDKRFILVPGVDI